MSEEIVLYDIPSKEGHCWSLNPWKTRIVLNMKGIPYRTEWIEYPDLKPTFQKFCIPPNTSGMEYTSPAIRLPDGTYIMDSFAIAQKLESLHPTPSLHLDSPYQSRIEEFLPTMVNQVRPIFMPLVPQKFLNPRSKEYFISTREKALGMPLEQYAKNAKQGFTNVKPYAKELGDMYAENDGPFLMGKEVCYADIMVLGWLRMFDRLGEVSKIFEMEGGEKLKDVYQTTGKWFERDTY